MKILELRLKISDLIGARAFYHEVLKLPIIVETTVRLVLQAGGTRLVFEYEMGWQGKYHFAFDIPENQLEAAAAWIDGKVEMATLPEKTLFRSDGWNASMVYFYDPVGNILEFVARHNQPNATTVPFSESSIISVSEIGLATMDVPQTVNWLCDTLGVPVYDSPDSNTFTAVGDESGLFIVVKEGRIWFPDTHIPAGLSAVDVTVSGDKAGDYVVPGLPYHVKQI